MNAHWRYLGLLSLCIWFGAGVGSPPGNATLAQAGSPQAVYFSFDPLVIPLETEETVRFTAKVLGSPSRAILELNPDPASEVELHDDGADGDALARDGVYSAVLPAQAITSTLQETDVFRPFVGFLKLFQGDTLSAQVNVFAEVLTSGIPRLGITPLAEDAQFNDYLVNVYDPDFFESASFDYERIARRFYQLFPDDYDFLNIVFTPSHFQNRFHFAVQNDVFGIGLSRFDNASRYGSGGRLLGITVFPITYFFDGASEAYQHELGHQWINFLNVPPLDGGIPHWPLSSLASGIMGWSDPVNGQGLSFPCLLVNEGGAIRLMPRQEPAMFTDLDLYLMGLLSPDQVGTHYVFEDQSVSPVCDGQIYQGRLIPVTASDVIKAVGPRTPGVESAPHRFKIATLIVSKDGLLSEEAMSFYAFFAQRAELDHEVLTSEGFAKGVSFPFALTTRGLGSIDARLVVTP